MLNYEVLSNDIVGIRYSFTLVQCSFPCDSWSERNIYQNRVVLLRYDLCLRVVFRMVKHPINHVIEAARYLVCCINKFSATFTTLRRRLWISHSDAKLWDTPVNNRGVPFFYSFLDYFRLRLEIRLHQ